MGRTANDLIAVFQSWIGFSEKNGKHKQIIDKYNSVKPLPRGYAVKYTDNWCDTTLSAAGIVAGMSDLIGRECSCQRHIDIFKKLGIWNEDGSITPKPGYIIVYNWDDKTQPNDGWADHIGIVEKVVGNKITTIEGNYSDSVKRRTIAVGNGRIRGYACPKYEVAQSTTKTSTVPAKATTGSKKDISVIAKEVMAGKWGVGTARKSALEEAGYDYAEVQAAVNLLARTSSSAHATKDYTTVAKEVIAGKWGNGAERRNRLVQAGYNYSLVQSYVSRLLR